VRIMMIRFLPVQEPATPNNSPSAEQNAGPQGEFARKLQMAGNGVILSAPAGQPLASGRTNGQGTGCAGRVAGHAEEKRKSMQQGGVVYAPTDSGEGTKGCAKAPVLPGKRKNHVNGPGISVLLAWGQTPGAHPAAHIRTLESRGGPRVAQPAAGAVLRDGPVGMEKISKNVGTRTLSASGMDTAAASRVADATVSRGGAAGRGGAVRRGAAIRPSRAIRLAVAGATKGARNVASANLPAVRRSAALARDSGAMAQALGKTPAGLPPALVPYSGRITSLVAKTGRIPSANRGLRISRGTLQMTRDAAGNMRGSRIDGMPGASIQSSAAAGHGGRATSSLHRGAAGAGTGAPPVSSAGRADPGSSGSIPGLWGGIAPPQNGRTISNASSLPSGPGRPSASAFTSDIRQLALRLASQVRPGEVATVAVSVSPAYLGQLRITVSGERAGRLRVSIQAERDGARELLASHQHELHEGLSMSGFSAISIDIGKREDGSAQGDARRGRFSQPTRPPDEFQGYLLRAPSSSGSASQALAVRSYNQPASVSGMFSGRA
jgi:hypothetical protein